MPFMLGAERRPTAGLATANAKLSAVVGKRPFPQQPPAKPSSNVRQAIRRPGDGMQAKGAHTVTQGIVADAFRDPAHQRSEHKGCSSEEREATMERGGSGVFCVRFRELLQDVVKPRKVAPRRALRRRMLLAQGSAFCPWTR